MVDIRHSSRREYHWTHFYSKDILLITSMAILCIWSQAQGQSSIDDKTCFEQISCISCTNKTNHNCTWSLKNQQCWDNTFISSVENFTVHDTQFCPNYIVKHKWIRNKKYMQSTVNTVLNDKQKDFNYLLENLEVKCFVGDKESNASVWEENIICQDELKYEEIETQLKKNNFGFHITINGSQLMFENDTDYFHTGYDRSCDSKKDDGCVTCSWHDSQYRYYNRWCSSSNTCTGLWHKSVNESVHASGINRTTVNPNVELMCPEIQIQLIGPKSGVLGGKTIVKFVVTNHRILIEKKSMTITVAGWDCVNTEYVNDNITCMVHAPSSNITFQSHEGPIQVIYKTEHNYTYAVTSKQLFKFVEPKLDKISTECVPAVGEYNLTIWGRDMDAGDSTVVTVAEQTRCETHTRNTSYVTCNCNSTIFSGKNNERGQVKVQFVNFSEKYVTSDVYVYSGHAEIVANQLFGSIATGGITIPVLGNYFQCAEEARFNVSNSGGINVGTVCDVKNNTYMECPSPMVNNTLLGSNTFITMNVNITIKFPNNPVFVPVTTPTLKSSNTINIYSDPVFNDFEIQNQSVVINGRNLEQGYRIDDLAVLFPDSRVKCIVTNTSSVQVRCKPSVSKLDDYDELLVKIGNKFQFHVNKTKNKMSKADNFGTILTSTTTKSIVVLTSTSNNPGIDSTTTSTTINPFNDNLTASPSSEIILVLVILLISLSLLIVIVLWFCLKRKRQYIVN